MTDPTAIMASARKSGLISPEDLHLLLQTAPEKIRLLDASYPSNPALPAIANAQAFDIDDIADPESHMAHMLPSPELFAEKVGELGIGNNDFVIVYDQSGLVMAASRAWWMFRVFGHDNVAVLDGGLISWIRKNYPLNTERESITPKKFNATFKPELVVSFSDVQRISVDKSAQLLDARPPERFVNHIPGSKNLPALSLVSADRHLKSADMVKQDLKNLDLDTDSPIVATCGSGVTACVIALALFHQGHDNVAVYDGSWTEWSTRVG